MKEQRCLSFIQLLLIIFNQIEAVLWQLKSPPIAKILSQFICFLKAILKLIFQTCFITKLVLPLIVSYGILWWIYVCFRLLLPSQQCMFGPLDHTYRKSQVSSSRFMFWYKISINWFKCFLICYSVEVHDALSLIIVA